MSDIMQHAIIRHCRKHKYSKRYTDFWIHHPFCDICGYHSVPHHIRTRGAGGSDKEGNLLALCDTHHTEVGTIGILTFAKKYGQFYDKIITALSERNAINIFVTRGQE